MRLFDETRSDARFALRAFRRSPGFTATALATLIVGIAAVTSIFSYMNAVYFAAFPYKDAGKIVALSQRVMNGNGNGSFSAVSLDAIRAMREPTRSFERVSAYRELGATIMVGSEPRRLTVLAVDSSFVPLFGLHPELGQLLSADEIVRRAPVAMISRELWRAQYGSDPGVDGTTLTLDARTVTVVGVLPRGFNFPYHTDAIVPLREAVDSGGRAHRRRVCAPGEVAPGRLAERRARRGPPDRTATRPHRSR